MSKTVKNLPEYSVNEASATAADQPAQGMSLFGINLTRALKIPLQQWKLTLACGVASALVAVVVTVLFGRQSWRAEGTLLHRPLGVPENQRTIYNPPTLQTLTDLVKSRHNLDVLCQEFQLSLPPEVLGKLITVTPSPLMDSQTVQVTLDWEDPQTGADMVNWLMKIHIEQVTALRKSTLEKYVTDTDSSLKACKERLALADKEHRNFLVRIKVPDLQAEIDRLKRDATALESSLNSARQERDNTEAQIVKLKEFVRTLRAKQETPGAQPDPREDKEYEAKRRELERLVTTEEGKLDEVRKRYDTKRREYERLLPLLARKVISKAEVEVVENEASTALGQVKTQEKLVKQAREELVRLRPGFAELKKAQDKLSDLESSLVGIKGGITRLEANLTASLKQTQEIGELKRQEAPFADAVATAKAEREQLEGQLRVLRPLRDSDADEMVIETRAVPSPHPTSSNRKKLAAATFGCCLLLSLGLVTVRGMRSAAWRAEALADRLGLAVLVRASPRQGPSPKGRPLAPDECRALSLRLRQYVPDPGAALLFSSLTEAPDVDALLTDLARSFAMRDEKVLLLDARIAHPPSPSLARLIAPHPVAEPIEVVPDDSAVAEERVAGGGLVPYLVFEGLRGRDCLHPTRIPAVDYMPSGGPYPMTDALASEAMRSLLEEMRPHYSLILIVGPSLARTVDTEILAAYVNGIVVFLNGPVSGVDAGIEEFVASLKEANAPLLGCIVSG